MFKMRHVDDCSYTYIHMYMHVSVFGKTCLFCAHTKNSLFLLLKAALPAGLPSLAYS